MTRIVVIILTLISTICASQSDSIWIGRGLSEVTFSNGQWYFQRGTFQYAQYTSRLIQEGDICYTVPEMGEEFKKEIGFHKLDPKSDTLILAEERLVHYFVKPHLLRSGKPTTKLQSFEYSIRDEFHGELKRYQLNKWNVFRISNFKNETLLEVSITDEEFRDFLILLNGIDLTHFDSSQNTYNLCNDTEYGFRFKLDNGSVFSYTSLHVLNQLKPLAACIINFENKYRQ